MRVAVVICTCNRPLGLKRVLESVSCLQLNDELDIEVFIIDNSQDGNAAKYVARVQSCMPWPLHYIHEDKPGVSYARNTGLESGMSQGFDYLANVDDDMHVDPMWLQELMTMAISSKADAVIGLKKFDYAAESDWWVDEAYRLDYRADVNGQELDQGHTGGCLICLESVRCSGIRFDESLGKIGGEDTLFFDSVLNNGGVILFAKHAVSYEVLKQDRMQVKWWLKRWYRTGTTSGIVELAAGRKTPFEVIIAGLFRILVGFFGTLIGLPSLAVQRAFGIRSIRLFFRGLGYIAAVFGVPYEEYANGGRTEKYP